LRHWEDIRERFQTIFDDEISNDSLLSLAKHALLGEEERLYYITTLDDPL